MKNSHQMNAHPLQTNRQGVIRTTLYELTEAVYDVAGPNGNEMVTAVLLQLLENCQSNVVVLKTEEEFGCFA
jgi:hypothetical protein